ncbi:efflux transporter outer membrane subunit [Jeongeupia naejangsanensis]|uniref:Efflux transporter outer membrane subunit n=1 Tax=Jeongeupia naejangsanensis TaxID=613195 RepID=A0ABS2BKU1_9NEIS|nr:efflux transporter outer membrane subunit [Jeongeupia naejangsanensis]MBM3116232.1 efflux transporter outer membrane subunit [Jeongeupia naejangsanensis]
MFRIRILPLILAAALTGCAVGPDYQRPDSAASASGVADAFSEVPDGWTVASPADHAPRGDWWTIYGDPVLNDLAAQVDVSNQNVAAAVARYRQARASAQEARSAFFPTLGLSYGASRNGSYDKSTQAVQIQNSQNLSLDASWEPDIWGGIRRQVESSDAGAEGSAADLAAARLSAQAELVQDYLQLRITDAQIRLSEETVVAYARSLQLTQNKYAAGIVTKADVAQAQSQYKSAQAQAIDLALTRKQLAHAIAILVGKAPSQFALAADPGWKPALPVIPAGVPSQLLERRPDVASAERAVASANAQVGVAKAAFFPSLVLKASGGFQSASLSDWFNAPGRVWALGATVAETIFDAGARSARSDQAVAAYDASVASYRQTVLGSLQEVEDNLAAIDLLGKEVDAQNDAVAAAREAERLALNQYTAGTVDYLNVASSQTTRYASEKTALQLVGRQLSASVLLIKAIGGGWDGNVTPQLAQP